MSRRTLARAGGILSVLGGLVLALVTAQSVAARGLFATPGAFPTPGEIATLSILPMIASLAIPLGILVGLFGLFALLGTSLAWWGVRLTTVATFLLVVGPVIPYPFFLIDPSPGSGAVGAMILVSAVLSVVTSTAFAAGLALFYVAARQGDRLGSWRPLLPALGFAVVVSSGARFALAATGLPGGTTLSEVSTFVVGVLWMALGVVVWRHAPLPENHNVDTAPTVS